MLKQTRFTAMRSGSSATCFNGETNAQHFCVSTPLRLPSRTGITMHTATSTIQHFAETNNELTGQNNCTITLFLTGLFIQQYLKVNGSEGRFMRGVCSGRQLRGPFFKNTLLNSAGIRISLGNVCSCGTITWPLGKLLPYTHSNGIILEAHFDGARENTQSLA